MFRNCFLDECTTIHTYVGFKLILCSYVTGLYFKESKDTKFTKGIFKQVLKHQAQYLENKM